MHAGDGRIVAGRAVIQIVAHLADAHSLAQRRLSDAVAAQGKFRDLLPGPAKAHKAAQPRVDGAVAHDKKGVADLRGKAEGIDGFAGDELFVFRDRDHLAAPDEDTARVLVFKQDASAVVENLQNREGRVRRAGARVGGKRVDDGLHAVLQRRAVEQHLAEDLACQGREHIGAHAAAHAVGQNQDIRVRPVDDLHLVAAQDLPRMVEAPAGHFRRDSHISSSPSCLAHMPSRDAGCRGLAYWVLICSLGFAA